MGRRIWTLLSVLLVASIQCWGMPMGPLEPLPPFEKVVAYSYLVTHHESPVLPELLAIIDAQPTDKQYEYIEYLIKGHLSGSVIQSHYLRPLLLKFSDLAPPSVPDELNQPLLLADAYIALNQKLSAIPYLDSVYTQLLEAEEFNAGVGLHLLRLAKKAGHQLTFDVGTFSEFRAQIESYELSNNREKLLEIDPTYLVTKDQYILAKALFKLNEVAAVIPILEGIQSGNSKIEFIYKLSLIPTLTNPQAQLLLDELTPYIDGQYSDSDQIQSYIAALPILIKLNRLPIAQNYYMTGINQIKRIRPRERRIRNTVQLGNYAIELNRTETLISIYNALFEVRNGFEAEVNAALTQLNSDVVLDAERTSKRRLSIQIYEQFPEIKLTPAANVAVFKRYIQDEQWDKALEVAQNMRSVDRKIQRFIDLVLAGFSMTKASVLLPEDLPG